MVWYVSPDGKVYDHLPPESEEPLDSGIFVEPMKPRSSFDDAETFLNGQADRDLKKAQTEYWKTKAKNEEQKWWEL